ncbi:MAG TPA: ATP-binding protein [Rhodocyclaceae bacterium]|nr:ATP-binding protein [Rhodocyclaceae bacterium]
MRAFFGSMLGRVFFLLVGGVLASAALTLYFFQGEQQEFLDQLRNLRAEERIEQLTLMLDQVPAATRPQVLAAASRNGILAEYAGAAAGGSLDADFVDDLKARLGDDRRILAWQGRGVECQPLAGASGDRCEITQVSLKDGTALRFLVLLRRPDYVAPALQRTQRRQHQLAYFVFFLVCLCLLAYAVASFTTKPLQRLALAARNLGRDIDHPPLVVHGTNEVRHAAGAFNAMQAQIRSFIRERTQMLAAITHDLQTPLTRARLRLEKVADQGLREKLVGDLAAMEGMIRDGLDLATSTTSREATQRMDFDSIVDSVCADAVEAGQDVAVTGLTRAFVLTRPNAMRRCLTNLIDNAVHYGARARITASTDGSKVIVTVRDSGPGIPEDRLEAVFEAFFRLEGSRSRDTGGTGIGLTIARNIAVQHGGTLTLANGAAGGLVARLELPCA